MTFKLKWGIWKCGGSMLGRTGNAKGPRQTKGHHGGWGSNRKWVWGGKVVEFEFECTTMDKGTH